MSIFQHTILIKGAGGIGFNLVLALIHQYIKEKKSISIIIVDHDTVDVTNLNRLPLKDTSIGMYKVKALEQYIVEDEYWRGFITLLPTFINTTFEEFLQSDFDFSSIDIVIDCSDILEPNIYNSYPDNLKPLFKLSYDGLSNAAIILNPAKYIENMYIPNFGEENTNSYAVTPSNFSNPCLLAKLFAESLFKDDFALAKKLKQNPTFSDYIAIDMTDKKLFNIKDKL